MSVTSSRMESRFYLVAIVVIVTLMIIGVAVVRMRIPGALRTMEQNQQQIDRQGNDAREEYERYMREATKPNSPQVVPARRQ